MSAGRIFGSASSDRFWRRLPAEANFRLNSRNWPPKMAPSHFRRMDFTRAVHHRAVVLQSALFQSRAGGSAPAQDPLRPRATSLGESQADRVIDPTAPAASQLELPAPFRQPGGGGGTTAPGRPDAFLCFAVALHEKPRAVQARSPGPRSQSGRSGG